MRTMLITVVAALVAAAAAGGAVGDILASFPSPYPHPVALGYGGSNLYVLRDAGGADIVYRLNPNNGSILASFYTPAGDNAAGLAYMGGNLWTGDANPDRIYQTNLTGSTISSFNVPALTGGVAPGGANLWYTNGTQFRQVTTTGSLVSSFSKAFTVLDPGFDGTYLYVGSNNPVHMLYKLTTTGSVVASRVPPSNHPWGCAYAGTYVYFSTTGNHYIYRMDPGTNTAVAPSSMGKVKALFR